MEEVDLTTREKALYDLMCRLKKNNPNSPQLKRLMDIISEKARG